MNKALVSFAALATLVLAGCSDAPDSDAAVTVQSQPDGSRTVEVQVPESMAPAVDAMANPQQALDNFRSEAGAMSEQMKQDAVVAARRAAEDGARALGQTEAEIVEAGDVAERSTRQALGLQ